MDRRPRLSVKFCWPLTQAPLALFDDLETLCAAGLVLESIGCSTVSVKQPDMDAIGACQSRCGWFGRRATVWHNGPSAMESRAGWPRGWIEQHGPAPYIDRSGPLACTDRTGRFARTERLLRGGTVRETVAVGGA